jgi:hypothetical protein
MTTQETMKLIGTTAQLPCEGMMISVRITDAKNSYGSDRVLITPVSGSGSRWVNLSSLKIS